MTNKRLDPSKYPDFYQNHGYSFLQQSLIDDFSQVVSNELEKRRKFWVDEVQSSESELEDESVSWESFKDKCYREARIEEIEELSFLKDELVIIGLYRFIEIQRNRVLLERFPFLNQAKLYNYRYILKNLPFLQNLYGAEAINELRLICNCIKHSGRVSRELAKCHHTWKEGEPLKQLSQAYERLAPFIGAYWVDFVQKAKNMADEYRSEKIQ